MSAVLDVEDHDDLAIMASPPSVVGKQMNKVHKAT
jgi:hypothetical protein